MVLIKTILLAFLLIDVEAFIYFDQIRNVVESLKHYLHTGLEGLAKLAETLETVENFVDATIDEDCEPFKCPSGLVPVSNPEYIPESNGCGSFGFQWKEEKLPLKDLEQCCHSHDFCYDECGADKDLCDLKFKKCLYKVCSNNEEELSHLYLKACKGTAKIMYTGTLALGCKSYQVSQGKACQCFAKKRQEL